MSTIIKFEEFLGLPSFFCYNIGIKLRGPSNGFWLKFWMYLTSFNLFLAVSAECYYIIVTIRTDFTEAIMTLSYVSFIVVAFVKWYYLYNYQTERNAFFQRLEVLFPHTKSEQESIKLSKYFRSNKLATRGYTISIMVLIWVYNLYTISQSFIYTKLMHVDIERVLPYQAKYPWDWHDNWTYYLIYVTQGIASFHSTCTQLGYDVLLCILSIHLIMHYDNISRSLEGYQTKFAEVHGVDSSNGLPRLAYAAVELRAVKEDIKFISNIVSYHNELLSLSMSLNKLFGVPLFVNFFTSSAIICFLSFQMSVTREIDLLMKVAVFLFFSVMQVYLISHFGQLLSDASTNVASAAYFQDWSYADVRFQKMTILVAARAQEPAALKATNLITISLDTMTVIIQMSYKFFTVLRTMYDD
ncbi:odorant receptor 85c-like [Bactrocera neohumeralis]|uniref:odorant receptor 85c-like n=1 Tax=Bactrocera neohumeralis TaxID=98809 RepID=UPI00216577D2|nr:odorant receptor 85c-like [Bactrocera neohumeralis]XP_050341817.1 odorant receptor 85c-like [Bactrocera neohumeralis]XP_050341818.1 odorant receptor 85c-like [Bactrocera neohumeralis]